MRRRARGEARNRIGHGGRQEGRVKDKGEAIAGLHGDDTGYSIIR